MARLPETREFIVRGSGAFPVDMLRYDTCYPATETDSSRIIDSHRARSTGEREIRLRGPVSINHPTPGRWSSFGWTLVAS